MRPIKFLMICGLGLALSLQRGVATAQTYGSQILMAHNANLILIGEVTYLTHLTRFPSTAVHYHSQVVVFRVREVIKGSYSEKFIKVNVAYSPERAALSESDFGHDKRFILLLERKQSPNDYFEDEFTSTPEFEKYAKVSCYRSYLTAIIEANDQEVEAIKQFATKSKNNK